MTSSSSTIHPTPAPHRRRRRRRRPRRLVSTTRLQVCLDETTETWTPRTNHTCFHEEARELYERFSSPITDVRHTRDARDAHESRARMRMWISSRRGRNASPSSLDSHSHSSDARRIDTSLSMSGGRESCFVLLIYRAATTILTTDAVSCRTYTVGAVKAIRSMRLWAHETFKSREILHLVCMATPEDLTANAEYVT